MRRPKPFVDPALQGADYAVALAKVMLTRIPFEELEVGVIYRCVIDRVTDNGLARYMGDGVFSYDVAPDNWMGCTRWTLASAYDESLKFASSLVWPIKSTRLKKLRGESTDVPPLLGTT